MKRTGSTHKTQHKVRDRTLEEFEKSDLGSFQPVIEVLCQGGIVCCPTETFYGLAVDAQNHDAVNKLVAIKGRDAHKPIALIVPSLDSARLLWTVVPPQLVELAHRYWPGPLTMAAPARHGLPAALISSDGTVAVRMSSHPLAHQLAATLGGPITATSANQSGQPPPTTIDEARAQLGNTIDAYLDGGPTPGGAPSTLVVFATNGTYHIARQGAVVIADKSSR